MLIYHSPGLLNSVTGLITTLVNVYTAQGGLWSITAVITCVSTGTCLIIFVILYMWYRQLLNKVKAEK